MINKKYQFIILILTYIIIYWIYHNPSNYYIKNISIQELNDYNINYFKNNFGNEKILVSYSPSNSIDMDTEYYSMKLSEYFEKYFNNSDYYFKTEDQYNFLEQINLESKFLRLCRQIFKHNLILNDRISFWLGGIGTTTSFHVDIEDISYLYIIEGCKKIYLINPKYTRYMYPYPTYYHYAIYSQIDFKNIDYQKYPLFKYVKIETVILKEGQSILIPRNWWHAVENIIPTVAISYKLYRPIFCFFGIIPELVRYYFSRQKGNNYIWKYLKFLEPN